VAIGLGILVGATQARAANPQVWQGAAFITGFPNTTAEAACAAGNTASVGDDFVIEYRPIIPGSPANGTGNDEGISFFGGRNGLHYFTHTGVRFTTPGKAYVISLGSRASSSEVANTGVAPSIPFSLTISPANISLTTPTVTISGTLDDWFNVTGCNVTFNAALDRRNN
jgi:hypothetical protein